MLSSNEKVKLLKKSCLTRKRKSAEAEKMADALRKVEVKNKKIDDVLEAKRRNVKYLDTPAKSEHDRNEYRVIELENGLTALLISVPSDDTGHYGACCDVCINVGTFSDPPECPGLAQMSAIVIYNESKKRLQMTRTATMFKLVDKKCPWHELLMRRMPHHQPYCSIPNQMFYKNAKDFARYPKITVLTSTGCEETNVRLCMVPEECFLEALKSFSETIISREILLKSVTLARIQTELRMGSRLQTKNQLLASFAKARHPASKYSTSNLQALYDVEEEAAYELFVKFRDRHYSAHRTTVMIKAQLSLDTLQKYAVDFFSRMPSNNLPAQDFAEFKGIDPFESIKPRVIHIQQAEFDWPLEMIWTIPLMDENQIYKAHDYLIWILRYKGKGSLFSYLENKKWCSDIGCSSSSDNFSCNSLYTTLNLGLVITIEGLNHITEVVSAVFSYINMLRNKGPRKRIFEEIVKVKTQKFRYMNTFWTETFSKRMQLFAPARYITGNELFLNYDEKSIKFCTDLLTPERMNIISYKEISKSSLDFDLESLFGTEKMMEEIPEEWIQYWKTVEPISDFRLPKADAFVADNFPSKIYTNKWSEIWYKYEEMNFRAGESHVNLHFISPLVMTSPENVAMLDLFASILKDRVALLKYSECDMNCELRPGMKGLWLNVDGFEAIVLPLMIKSVVTSISQCWNAVTEDVFNSTKQKQLQQYRSTLKDPIELAEDLKQSIVVSVYRSFVDLHAALLLIEYRQFCNFMKDFVDDVRIQCYAHGRMTKQDVIACVQTSFGILNRGTANPRSASNHGVTQIPLGVHCSEVQSFDRLSSGSAVTNYYQFDNPSFELATMIDALSTVMQQCSPNHSYCIVRGIYGLYGYSLTGSDCKARVEDIDEGIEAFRKFCRNTFVRMTKKQLTDIKTKLLFSKEQECAMLEMDLETKINANWIEIMSEKYVFDRRARELSFISEMSVEELRSWMIKLGMSQSDSRIRKLSVRVHGCDNQKSVKVKVPIPGRFTIRSQSPDSHVKSYFPLSCTSGHPDVYLTNRHQTQRIDNLEKDYPHIYKLNEYKLKYVENRSKDSDKNTKTEQVITDLNAYKRKLNVIPLKLSTF